MTWRSRSSKKKSSPGTAASVKRLASVRRQREPFVALSRRIIAETLTGYLPKQGNVVEIGMGDGQLWERLPAEVLPRMIHTEPDADVTRVFRKEHPEVNVLAAPAERLPLADDEAAAVLGLCVMDVVPDIARVAREVARVLRPGGRFIHWLDMSTVLTPVVTDLAGSGLVPFPNFFTEIASGEWPDDLFLVPRQQLDLIASVLRSKRPELARPLEQYSSVFAASPFTPSPAAAELVQLQESSALRTALKTVFRAAFELANPEIRERLASFQGRPVSSARHFEQRLRAGFNEELGFQIERSCIDCVWETVPRTGNDFAYLSACVGEQRALPHLPEKTWCPDLENIGDESSVRLQELGVFVFVAGRNATPSPASAER